MKKYFKFSQRTNQYYTYYKGMPINIDKETFENSSEDEIAKIIKSLTTQTSKKRQEEDIVPHDEGKELFKAGLKKIKPENFREFYDLMSNA
jgi:hypothetical protein